MLLYLYIELAVGTMAECLFIFIFSVAKHVKLIHTADLNTKLVFEKIASSRQKGVRYIYVHTDRLYRQYRYLLHIIHHPYITPQHTHMCTHKFKINASTIFMITGRVAYHVMN